MLVLVRAFDPLEEETMNTQAKSEMMAGPDSWVGIDDRQFAARHVVAKDRGRQRRPDRISKPVERVFHVNPR